MSLDWYKFETIESGTYTIEFPENYLANYGDFLNRTVDLVDGAPPVVPTVYFDRFVVRESTFAFWYPGACSDGFWNLTNIGNLDSAAWAVEEREGS